MRYIENSDGELVLRYYQYNEQIVQVSYPVNDTCLPIMVISQDAMRAAKETVAWIERGFIAVYVLEALVGLAVYFKKVKRL